MEYATSLGPTKAPCSTSNARMGCKWREGETIDQNMVFYFLKKHPIWSYGISFFRSNGRIKRELLGPSGR